MPKHEWSKIQFATLFNNAELQRNAFSESEVQLELPDAIKTEVNIYKQFRTKIHVDMSHALVRWRM